MILHSKKELDVYMTGFDVPYVPQRRMKGTSCRMDEGYVLNAIKNIERRRMMMKRKPLEFYENYQGCWICCSHTGKNSRGYYHIKRHRKTVLLHRYMWEKHHGKIPFGIFVLHKCDNPACCSPEHLFLGTHHDNMYDMKNKGRQVSRKGALNGRAVLTEKQVAEIKESRCSCETLAKMYGVLAPAISKIKTGKTWRYV